MLSRVAVLLSIAIVIGASTPLVAGTIPCDFTGNDECITAPTCQENGTCRGEPAREGEPCSEDSSGGCMTNAFCRNGVCKGTVPMPAGTACNYPGLEKCYSPGQCFAVAEQSFCQIGTPKTCPPPTGPCRASACNGQTGECVEGDACNTFQGCEVCEGSVCRAANIGEACANPEGDFNSCTTNDRCVILGALSTSALALATTAHLPPALAVAMGSAQQLGQTRAFCQGNGGGEIPTPTPTTVTPPTPTVGPGACTGDCNGDGEVTVNELITMVNIALGSADISACRAGDGNGSGDISIDEIVSAVNRTLGGCGS